MVREGRLDIPSDCYKFRKRVSLCADAMFISGLLFLVTSSRNIKFMTLEFLPNCQAGQLAKNLRKFLNNFLQVLDHGCNHCPRLAAKIQIHSKVVMYFTPTD